MTDGIHKTETGAIVFEGRSVEIFRVFAIEAALKARATRGLVMMRNLTIAKLRKTDPEKVGSARTYKQAYENWKAWTDENIRNQQENQTK